MFGQSFMLGGTCACVCVWICWPEQKKKEGAVRELNPRPLAPEARIIPLDQRPCATYRRGCYQLSVNGKKKVVPGCEPVSGPPWPNGQGAPLLRVRLWVRVPLGVKFCFYLSCVQAGRQTAFPKKKKKKFTPCGIQTHNLQIRSLTRCSVAPTGQEQGQKWAAAFCLFCFLRRVGSGNGNAQTETKKKKQCSRRDSNPRPWAY